MIAAGVLASEKTDIGEQRFRELLETRPEKAQFPVPASKFAVQCEKNAGVLSARGTSYTQYIYNGAYGWTEYASPLGTCIQMRSPIGRFLTREEAVKFKTASESEMPVPHPPKNLPTPPPIEVEVLDGHEAGELSKESKGNLWPDNRKTLTKAVQRPK